MTRFESFVTIVLVVRDRQAIIGDLLGRISLKAQACLSEYEIIVVDNASTDGTVETLESLVQELPDVRVYCLVNRCDEDVALIAGLENSIGDHVFVMEPSSGAEEALPDLMALATRGYDVVYAENRGQLDSRDWLHKVLRWVFLALYRRLSGQGQPVVTTRNRILSRSVVNYLLQHNNAALLFRVMPSTLVGFKRAVVEYEGGVTQVRHSLGGDVHNALTLLLSSSHAPIRLMALLSLGGAVLNVVYSGYVMAIYMLKRDVAPGWVTLSLQNAGMFFLFSLVLAILSEYILRMFANSIQAPPYYVAREFSSEQLSRRERLNILRSVAAKES